LGCFFITVDFALVSDVRISVALLSVQLVCRQSRFLLLPCSVRDEMQRAGEMRPMHNSIYTVNVTVAAIVSVGIRTQPTL
jgi:hypothetical protein